MSHPVLSSALFILSRTLLYAAAWFGSWTAYSYFMNPGGFCLKVSADNILLYLFAGWLFAVLNWQAGGDKKRGGDPGS
jgi:hypothetical protein